MSTPQTQPQATITRALKHHNTVRALLNDGAKMGLVGVSHDYGRAIDRFGGVGVMLEDAQRYGDALPTWVNRHIEATRRRLVAAIDSGKLPTDAKTLATKMVRELDAEAEALSDPNLRWRKSDG